MATKREYLVTLGLAKDGRGKFSAAAHAALDAAIANGVVFDEPVKPEPKPRKAAAPKPKPALTLVKPASSKPARTIETEDANGKRTTITFEPEAGPRPIVRPERTLYAISPSPVGATHIRIAYDLCQRCAYSVQTCTCTAGPKPPAGTIPVPSYPKV